VGHACDGGMGMDILLMRSKERSAVMGSMGIIVVGIVMLCIGLLLTGAQGVIRLDN